MYSVFRTLYFSVYSIYPYKFCIVTAPGDSQEYLEVLIGVLTAIILLLLLVFFIILFLNRRQKLQSSPTVLKNPFGFAINMKVEQITFHLDFQK